MMFIEGAAARRADDRNPRIWVRWFHDVDNPRQPPEFPMMPGRPHGGATSERPELAD